MLTRVERIRNQEHLFVDTVDEQYVSIYEEMAPTYTLWRQYGREQALYQQDYEARAQSRDRIGRSGEPQVGTARHQGTHEGSHAEERRLARSNLACVIPPGPS